MISGKIPKIGDRIECAGQYGTIKYIGEVEGYEGEWYGIEWDDPQRGKHNGAVRGKQYFVAKHPRSASFVRPEKISFGQSAISAIQSRYGQKNDVTMNDKQQLLSVQQTMNAPFLELVGFDKISNILSNFNKLRIINIRLQGVNSPGEPMALKNMCPNISELDISKNLFTRWSDIFDICSQLDHLYWLNVSENFLVMPDNYTEYKFETVRTLICGSMEIDWSDVQKIATVFPNIQELRAPNNRIRSLDTPEDHKLQKLSYLDLESNAIETWENILKLSEINTLEQIIIENIGINKIRFPGETDQKTDMFLNLKKLTVSNNKIADWKSVGELNKLNDLQELRLLKNPVLETENYATCFQLVTARIASLRYFNGTCIKSDERKGAEYDYLKKYGLEWLAVKDDPEKRRNFLENHNRYLELIEKYGAPEESELKQQSKSISGSLMQLRIVCDDLEVCKSLPPTILVRKLVMLVQRLFGLSSRPVLLCISDNQPDIEIELDDDGKELGFYSVQNGDKIIVKS